MIPPDPVEVFGPALRGNLKTYVTSAVGLVVMFLSAFDIVELTPKQVTCLTGGFVLLAFVFQRLATWKAQRAAAEATIAAHRTLAAVAEIPQAVAAAVAAPPHLEPQSDD